MNSNELRKALARDTIVPLTREEWESVAGEFPEEERHATQLAGDLVIVRVDGKLVAVEEPSPQARVARLLGTRKEADAFVENRLAEYERMWDGCGVKVEYYGG